MSGTVDQTASRCSGPRKENRPKQSPKRHKPFTDNLQNRKILHYVRDQNLQLTEVFCK
jgi:hypothetical protein